MPSITLEAERTVLVDGARVRAAAAEVLRRLGFRITSEMATVLEAQRGSAVRSVMLMPDQVPVSVGMQFTAGPGGGSTVRLQLADRAVSAVVLGVQGPYQEAFLAVLAGLDRALSALDPKSAALGFPEPRWWARGRNVEALERGHAIGQRFVGGAAAKISEALSGGPRSTGPASWSGYDRLVFSSSAGTVTMDMDTARTLLAIPVMISSRPGALPPALAAQVDGFAAFVEGRLGAGGRGTVLVEVADEQRKTFEFLHQQLGIRSQLPVRTLCVCRDCRHPKVVNLDLQRLREKNRNLKMLVSVLGMSAGHGEPNPFMVFGSVFRQAKLDPDYVCGRCESTEAEEQPVTFCPECGDLRKESVLVTCGKCGHDLRGLVKGVRIWEPRVEVVVPPLPSAPPLPPAPPVPSVPPVSSVPQPSVPQPSVLPPPSVPPVPATRVDPYAGLPVSSGPPARVTAPVPVPQQACAICGGRFRTLWLIQLGVGPAARSLAVCATTPRCSPRSSVPPVQV